MSEYFDNTDGRTSRKQVADESLRAYISDLRSKVNRLEACLEASKNLGPLQIEKVPTGGRAQKNLTTFVNSAETAVRRRDPSQLDRATRTISRRKRAEFRRRAALKHRYSRLARRQATYTWIVGLSIFLVLSLLLPRLVANSSQPSETLITRDATPVEYMNAASKLLRASFMESPTEDKPIGLWDSRDKKRATPTW